MRTDLPGLTIAKGKLPCTAEAEDPDSFLNALSPFVGLGSDEKPHRLVYRGQSDETWPLVPSSRRRDNWPLLGISLKGEHNLLDHLRAEARNFLDFTSVALKHGLTVPYRANSNGDILDQIGEFAQGRNPTNAMIDRWPPDLAVSSLGLAQHAGLHTCLLDFTFNPYVAAYFAAYSAARERIVGEDRGPHSDSDTSLDRQVRSPCIAVWVLAYTRLTLNKGSNERPVLLRPPGFENLALQLQEGVFMFAPESIPIPTPVSDSSQSISRPLDEYFDSESDSENPSIVKLVLNAQHAGELMGKLARIGIETARLFPTYEGVVKSLGDRHFLGARYDS